MVAGKALLPLPLVCSVLLARHSPIVWAPAWLLGPPRGGCVCGWVCWQLMREASLKDPLQGPQGMEGCAGSIGPRAVLDGGRVGPKEQQGFIWLHPL